MQTILLDTFVGTVGNSITGTTPNLVANGSDVWGDFSSLGFGVMEFVSGGGCKALSYGSGGTSAYALYPLTGASQTATYTLVFATSDSTADAQMILRRASDGSTSLNVSLAFSNNKLFVQSFSGGSTSQITPTGGTTVSPNVGTANTIVITCTATTIAVSLNGTQILAPSTIPSSTINTFVFGQLAGTAGSIVFNSVKVQEAGGPTTATLSGPTTGTAGTASTFSVALDAVAVDVATAVPLSDSLAGGTFAGSGVSGTTLTIPANTLSATFLYTRTTAGTSSISIAPAGLTIIGSPISYVASSGGSSPTTATVTGPSVLTIGTPSTYTVTLNANAGSGGVSFTPSVSGFAATFSPSTVTIASGSSTGTFNATSSTAGTGSIGGTATGLSVTSASVTSAAPNTGGLQLYYPVASLSTIYFVITKSPYQAWNGTAFETQIVSDWTLYAIPASDSGSVGIYFAIFPAAIASGTTVSVYGYLRSGSTPAASDTLIGTELNATWNGTSLVPSSGSGSGVTDTSVQYDVTEALNALGFTSSLAAQIATNLNATVSSRSTLTGPAGFSSLTIVGGGVNVNLAQTVPLVDQTAVTAPSVGNCLAAAQAAACGDQSKPNTPGVTTGTLKNADGSNCRTFTYDSGSAPSQRT